MVLSIPFTNQTLQQLNFYSFRKIKYHDSLRIDLETEKKTANYWRFRHEHFQRGRPDLLTQIKRTNGKGSVAAAASKPEAVSSSVAAAAAPAVDKSEVLTLKKRIDEMTKNMDALTEMVQKVSLQQATAVAAHDDDDGEPGMKRKKMSSVEEQALQESLPDGVFSGAAAMDLDDLALAPEAASSMMGFPPVASLPASRETSIDSNEFVDQLFTAFNEDEGLLEVSSLEEPKTQQDDSASSNDSNRPHPELMKRLSDALELLPKNMQEMIVNRLIAAITSTDFLADVNDNSEQKKVAASGKALPQAMVQVEEAQEQPQQTTMPLAAATLAALLHHYTTHIKELSGSSPGKKQLQKTIPVIPVHA